MPENEIAADGPAPGSMDSPDGTLARRGEILARCRDGLLAYPELLRILKPLISPQEADDARLAARESLRMLGYAAACGVLLQVLIYGVPADRTTTPAVLYDLLKAQSIVIPLVLVSRFRVHLAGRTLMPLVGLLDFYRPAAASWHLADYGGPLFLTLVSYFLVGCLLDFGASAEPGRARPRARRWTLTILGAAMLAWSLYESVTIHHPMLFSAAASFLCSAWGYWIAPRLERRGSLDVPDAETLRLIALQRWGRFAIGRSLAILLGTLPFVIFLHTLQFKQRLAWPERPDSAATVHTGTGDHAKVWFWKPRGRLLRLADFGQNELYGVPRSEAIAVLAEAARSQESKYRALKTRLGAHRLRNEADFAKLFLVETKPRVYLLEPQSARANWLSSGMVWNPIVEDEIESDQLTGYTKDELTAKAANYFVRQVLLLSYGLLGFTILWRRGGDSRLARYLGCWLLGVAMAGSARYTMLFLPQIRYSVWHHALSLPWQNLFLAIATVVQVLNGTLLYLFVLFVPCAAIWILRCWPNRLNGERFQRLRRFLGWIKLALVSVGMILVFWGTLILIKGTSPTTPARDALAALAACLLFLLTSFLAGYWLRHRHEHGKSVSAMNWLSGLAFLAVQPVIALAAIDGFFVLGVDRVIKSAALVLGVLFLVALMYLILKRDFLRICSVRDISFMLTYGLLPILFASFEEVSKNAVSESGLVPSPGGEIAAILVAVALLPRLRELVEGSLLHLTDRSLGKIEREIDGALEGLDETNRDQTMQTVASALAACGLSEYALYARTGRGRYAVALSTLTGAAETVEVSEPLRRYLARRRRPINLGRVALEWQFFFYQFEFARLKDQTASQYLVPILVGNSLRGLLLLPEAFRRGELVDNPGITEITHLGVVAVHSSFQALMSHGASPARPADPA